MHTQKDHQGQGDHQHGDQHPGQTQVLIKYGGPNATQTRKRWMPNAVAALWENGGVNADKFNALDVYGQWDALNQPDTDLAIRQQPGYGQPVADWINSADASGVYTHSLPSDFPKCPTAGLTGVVYIPAP